MKAPSQTQLSYQLLYLVHDRCGLVSLVYIGSATKASQDLTTLLVQQNLQDIILRAVQAAADCLAASSDQKHLQVLKWLLKAAGQAAVSRVDAAPILQVPTVPTAAAAALVSAGLRVTYQQLIKAASNCVPGFEVWMKAHEELGVPNVFVPGWAAAVCCNRPEVRSGSLCTLSTSSAHQLWGR